MHTHDTLLFRDTIILFMMELDMISRRYFITTNILRLIIAQYFRELSKRRLIYLSCRNAALLRHNIIAAALRRSNAFYFMNTLCLYFVYAITKGFFHLFISIIFALSRISRSYAL